MRARYLPLLSLFSLMAACAGGAASAESSPAPDTGTASLTDAAGESESGYAAADPLECAETILSRVYQKEGGSVEAGFLRYNTFRPRGGMFRLPYNATLLTVRRTNGVLYVEGPSYDQRNEMYNVPGTTYSDHAARSLRMACNAPVTASPQPGGRGD